MAKKNSLNAKRLSKKETKDLLSKNPPLHHEFTRILEEIYRFDRHKAYILPDSKILFVFDENGISSKGKGVLYEKLFFEKFINQMQRINSDYANGRGSSVGHWHFYSKFRDKILSHIEEARQSLSNLLAIPISNLDFSYASLDLISAACSSLTVDQIFTDVYDYLVLYVGEVIKSRVNGIWNMSEEKGDVAYPYIDISSERVRYMPVNVVWSAFNEIDKISLRKSTADEVRRHSFSIKMEKGAMLGKLSI